MDISLTRLFFTWDAPLPFGISENSISPTNMVDVLTRDNQGLSKNLMIDITNESKIYNLKNCGYLHINTECNLWFLFMPSSKDGILSSLVACNVYPILTQWKAKQKCILVGCRATKKTGGCLRATTKLKRIKSRYYTERCFKNQVFTLYVI